MRAAMLHGPGDLRVEHVAEPDGEILVHVDVCTACHTDVKMLRHGHRALGPYPARFGHEIAGVRDDTGERVLVGDSVACGACAPCAAGRASICTDMTWIMGGFAERIAAPEAALHAIPDGLPGPAAAMAEPLAAAVHAVARADGRPAEDAGVLGGGPMGLMIAQLLRLGGREVLVADRHAERRAQACAMGARAAPMLRRHDLVFEAVGRPEAWRAAVDACRPGGTVVLVGGCPGGTEVAFDAGPLHYAELDIRGAFHHTRAEVDEALRLLAAGEVPWTPFAGPTIGLEALGPALLHPSGGAATKLIVDPRA